MKPESGVRPPALSDEQMEKLRARVRDGAATDPAILEELSTTLGVAHRIRCDGLKIDQAYARLWFTVDCLLDAVPRLVLARDERLRLQFDIYSQSGFISQLLARISANSSAAMVITALLMSVFIWTIVAIVISTLSHNKFSTLVAYVFFMNGKVLTVVASGAFIGGLTSIASRLREFSRVRDLDPLGMFLTAMFKPLIGVVLSTFILATLAGGVISFGFLGDFLGFDTNNTQGAFEISGKTQDAFQISDKTLYILWMLAFLAGFSERFAWDFVDRAQGIAQGKSDTTVVK